MITFNFTTLIEHNITKGKLSKLLKLDRKYGSGYWDTALPQNWLNYFCKRYKNQLEYYGIGYHGVLCTSFMVYPKDSVPHIISGCKEVQEFLNKEI